MCIRDRINIREVSAKGSYWEDGHWVETEPMEIKRVYNFEEVGEKDMYLLHHEEIESLALNIPGIKRIRFFMTFGPVSYTHLVIPAFSKRSLYAHCQLYSNFAVSSGS